jgi:hypothetical protein
MKQNRIPQAARSSLGLALFCLASVLCHAAPKTTLLVPLDDAPGWRDMAFLAAVPASEISNDSAGSLVAFEAAAAADLCPEILDYLGRYKPDTLYYVGHPKPSVAPNATEPAVIGINATSAEDAALRLSQAFWKSSATAVICIDTDYPSALVAAPLAALLKAPLLFSTATGMSAATAAEIKRLGATRVLSIGHDIPIPNSLNLAQATDVMHWVKTQNIDIDYIAAVNPNDRSATKVRKLSMVGAQLAAGRNGLVAPLPFAVEWKKSSKSTTPDRELPANFVNQNPPARTGTLHAGSSSIPYILTGDPKGSNPALFIDRDASGSFTGPIHSGDSIELDGRKWMLSLGVGGSYHDADVHITWPDVDTVTARLREFYQILKIPPTYLCLVGLPDAIPQGIVRGRLLSPDVATDLPYARLDDPQSADIAVGRVVAETLIFGTLYAARVLTYPDLLDKSWSQRASQAEWENGFAPLFANNGFDTSYQLSDEDIPWLVKPEPGKPGERATSFSRDSPAARSNLLAHMNHSWNFELGRTMKWDAHVIIAPTLVESGGCGTTSLDRSAPGQAIVEGATGARSPELALKYRSVVSRLFRLGAVGFSGGSREMSAQQLPLRHAFWNGVLAGEPIGIAHRRMQNTGFLILGEPQNSRQSGGYSHNLHAKTLLGDPAVSIHLPAPPRTAPARTEIHGDRLTLHAPQKWEILKLFVPPDWKKWADRDIFIARAPGAHSLSHWGGDERDVEIPMVLAEFNSNRKIKAITPIEPPASPLGWSGTWQTMRHRDGTYTHRFSARMIEINQETGAVLKSIDRLDFSVTFE